MTIKKSLHCILLLLFFWESFYCEGNKVYGESTLRTYFAHKAAVDKYNVIAPWYKGQDGQCDFRIRVAAETLKRFPWVISDKVPSPAPYPVYDRYWKIDDNGNLFLPETEIKNLDGDFGQRSVSILNSMTDYYQYSGDPSVLIYIVTMADAIIEWGLSKSESSWPKFPMAVPEPYNYFGQIDIAGDMAYGILKAYKMTGYERYLGHAKRWADMFCEKAVFDKKRCPWDRYIDPNKAPWGLEPKGNCLTSGVVLIMKFLDGMIDIGYAGKNNDLVKVRNAGRDYLRDTLLDEWTKEGTWGFYYWDGRKEITTLVCTWACDYIMKNRDEFPNWKTDVRNIATLYFNKVSVDPGSAGDTYNGAWSFPEGRDCCGNSHNYSIHAFMPVFAQYAALTNDPWAKEVSRRLSIIGTYDARENGVVMDTVAGTALVAKDWLNLSHPWPLRHMLETVGWNPEELAPPRENHIVKSTTVVNNVIYSKGLIRYSTFDAPKGTTEKLRLSFLPESITADGMKLSKVNNLNRNGYKVKKLKNADCIVTIRHDGKKSIEIKGNDPQVQLDDGALKYTGDWKVVSDKNAYTNKMHVTDNLNASVEIKFIGNQVRVIGKTNETGGRADLYLDGKKQLVFIDCWSPFTKDQQILYETSGLSNTQHTLEIKSRCECNPLSKAANVYIDAIAYSSATGQNDSGVGGGPKDAQRFIFGYTKRSDYVDKQGNTWKPATEWCSRLWWNVDIVAHCWWTTATKTDIDAVADPELYRYGVHGEEFWINITTAPGKYEVHLLFGASGERGVAHDNMAISINGKEVATITDVAEQAGGLDKALDLTFKDVEPKNGIVEVRFKGTKGHAYVHAIELEPTQADVASELGKMGVILERPKPKPKKVKAEKK